MRALAARASAAAAMLLLLLLLIRFSFFVYVDIVFATLLLPRHATLMPLMFCHAPFRCHCCFTSLRCFIFAVASATLLLLMIISFATLILPIDAVTLLMSPLVVRSPIAATLFHQLPACFSLPLPLPLPHHCLFSPHFAWLDGFTVFFHVLRAMPSLSGCLFTSFCFARLARTCARACPFAWFARRLSWSL